MASLFHLPSSLTFRNICYSPSIHPIKASHSHFRISVRNENSVPQLSKFSEFSSKTLNFVLSGSLVLALSFTGVGIAEAKVGVNKPELLPKEFTPVIDVAGFLSDGQEKRLAEEITDIEKVTGFKLRVLAQNYPDTPGLAIKDFWQVDDRTIVFVADPTFGNILNFNVGATVDLDIPRSFWSRLAGQYGNMFYWKEKGEDASIEAAVMAISTCLREPVGPNNCSEVK
ncbi:thylakoid lumenal 15.0 kDa protein 2, chloroplastic-like isoform X2 [Nicotiana tabacum]|uniref:Thylakoid lumenal 15.0 kDa protein 2, chloroplastic-like n=1 Tax=Nicotiana tabacum TaxID=4097 RepID=A0A1S4A6A8_TOBAC|nr:thylakoid lumenal 15.0 kDa protein 2, chloroplastic [Nicotiana tomentosiformis]XP_016472101.1 PREDICTED: thylakoid lumenal 15.0 kDa protein 2, chloroplastic-like [Nicotiana tabacum]